VLNPALDGPHNAEARNGREQRQSGQKKRMGREKVESAEGGRGRKIIKKMKEVGEG
jgi:hypothetical protein